MSRLVTIANKPDLGQAYLFRFFKIRLVGFVHSFSGVSMHQVVG